MKHLLFSRAIVQGLPVSAVPPMFPPPSFGSSFSRHSSDCVFTPSNISNQVIPCFLFSRSPLPRHKLYDNRLLPFSGCFLRGPPALFRPSGITFSRPFPSRRCGLFFRLSLQSTLLCAPIGPVCEGEKPTRRSLLLSPSSIRCHPFLFVAAKYQARSALISD